MSKTTSEPVPETSKESVDFTAFPDQKGHFDRYGGIFIAETLMEPVRELRAA